MKKLIGLGILVLLLTFCPNANATIHIVHVGSFYFSPDSVMVNPGDTVRWVLDAGLHTTTSTGASAKTWDSGTLSGPYDLQFTLGDGAGPFPYVCNIHPFSMSGTIYMAAPAASPTLIPFLLDESQENSCAGNGSTAKGYGLAILSPDSTNLSLFVVHDVDSLTGAHIHTAASCVDGPITFPFSSATSPISQGFAVSPTNVADLFAGNLYVNIHSSSQPTGEIRGQIVPTAIKFLFTLDEGQEVPPTGSFANGCAVVELSDDGTELSIDIEHDVSNITGGHIHQAAPGVNGAIVFPFSSATSPISETWMLDTTDIKNLFLGNLYANVHSAAHTGGEIRGQIVRQPVNWIALLDGSQANGGAGTGSSFRGFGVLRLSADLTELDIYVEHEIGSPTDGHIHLGAPGVEGPIQFPFSSSTSPISETWNLTASDLDNLMAGDLYVNIHTAAFPSGEIRGQILKQKIDYSFFLDESEEDLCVGTGSPAIGFALTILKPWARQLNVSCEHNVSSPVDAHLHEAPQCVNGPIVFPFTSPASPFSGIWYLGRDQVIDLLGKQIYLNVHSNMFPAGEIRGQLEDCCVGIRGDVNFDGSVNPNILDLNYLVNYIFRFGARPRCQLEADTNSDGNSANILDLNFLVNYIFRFGSPPGPCR